MAGVVVGFLFKRAASIYQLGNDLCSKEFSPRRWKNLTNWRLRLVWWLFRLPSMDRLLDF